jgi:hypothetical protein
LPAIQLSPKKLVSHVYKSPDSRQASVKEKTHALLWAELKREKDYANRINEGKWPVGKP